MTSNDTSDGLILVCGDATGSADTYLSALRSADRAVHGLVIGANTTPAADTTTVTRKNVLDPDALNGVLDKIETDGGRIGSVVIAVPTTTEPLAAESLSDATWERAVEDVLTRTFVLTQAVGNRLIQRVGGSIVIVSTLNSLSGAAGYSHLCAAAAGIVGLVRTTAIEWGSSGVRINLIATPPLAADLIDPTVRAEVHDRTPLAELVSPSDVVAAITYLLGTGSSRVTGATLVIDAGLSAGMITRWHGADYASNALLERGVYAER